MSIPQEWQWLKTELQRGADRRITRTTGTVIQDCIKAALRADGLNLRQPLEGSDSTNRPRIIRHPQTRASGCFAERCSPWTPPLRSRSLARIQNPDYFFDSRK